MPADLDSARETVAEYREVLRTGDGAAVYAAVDQSFRDSSPLETAQQLSDIYRRLDEVCDPAPTEPSGWNASQNTTTGYLITLTYLRACKSGQLEETYVIKRAGEVGRIAGFHVNGAPVLALIAPPAQAQPAAATEAPASESAAPPT